MAKPALRCFVLVLGKFLGGIEYPRCRVDVPGVCQLVVRFCCANAAEWMEVLLGVKNFGDPPNSALDGSSDFL